MHRLLVNPVPLEQPRCQAHPPRRRRECVIFAGNRLPRGGRCLIRAWRRRIFGGRWGKFCGRPMMARVAENPRVVLDARTIRGGPGGVATYTDALIEHLPRLLPDVEFVMLRHP